MAEQYAYTVSYQDESGRDQSAEFGADKDGAKQFYDSLPATHYKAQWQVWREPGYGEQLMRVNNPRG